MAKNRYVGDYPVIGIRPIVDGRRGPQMMRESLEPLVWAMAESAKKLFEENLFYSNGDPVKVVMADTCIGRVPEAAACANKFKKEGVSITLSVTPCWCYGSNHGLERDNLRFLISNGIDGLLYVPEDLTAEEFHELTANRNIPIVQVDRRIENVVSDAVLVNNTEAVYQAVSRLLRKGHRRIASVTGPKYVLTAKERQIGYLRALSDFDVPFDDSLVISGENSFATGYRGIDTLLALKDPPTAVFTTNYNITIGLITAARERGLQIPEELDVFGFDSAEICTMMRPPIPVVQQPEKEIGMLAAEYLVERLAGFNGPPRVTRLECRILPEESV